MGNKEDLYGNEEVDEDEAKNLAKDLNAIFQKTTAKETNGSVDDLFMKIGQKLFFRQGFIQIEEETAGLVERFKHDDAFLIIAETFLEGLLGTRQSVAFHLEQLINHMHIAHVALREEAVAFLVLAWTQHVEFLLPVTYHRGVDVEHGGNFADAVVVFSGGSILFHDLKFKDSKFKIQRFKI